MGEVVRVEFGKKNVIEQQCVTVEPDLTAYLNDLREDGLYEDDVLEVLEAINDMNVYFSADDDIKQIADGWLYQFL